MLNILLQGQCWLRMHSAYCSKTLKNQMVNYPCRKIGSNFWIQVIHVTESVNFCQVWLISVNVWEEYWALILSLLALLCIQLGFIIRPNWFCCSMIYLNSTYSLHWKSLKKDMQLKNRQAVAAALGCTVRWVWKYAFIGKFKSEISF